MKHSFKYYIYVLDNGDRNILKRSNSLKTIKVQALKLNAKYDAFKDTDELNKFGKCLFICRSQVESGAAS